MWSDILTNQEVEYLDKIIKEVKNVDWIIPILRNIRKRGGYTKILQMPFVSDPHGRLTYPDDIKIEKFKFVYDAFKPWHDEVFFYLCMEKHDIWNRVFGWCFKNNEEFEREFAGYVITRECG